MNYGELAAFASTMPRIPRRELKCHPSVVTILRNRTLTGEYTVQDDLARLAGIDIFEDDDLAWGEYALIEDGRVVLRGCLVSVAGE